MASNYSPTKLHGQSPEKRLALYGLAAGAALASVSTTEASVMTLDLTGLSLAARTNAPSGVLYFDVNAASPAAAVGVTPFAGADFRFSNYAGANIKAYASAAAPGNGVAGAKYASRFTTGDMVGPANPFVTAPKIASNSSGMNFGNFAPGDTGYLGLRFSTLSMSDIHFGWANITLNADYTVTLNSLGYETDALTAVRVGPAGAVPDNASSLLLLALGAAGVAAFRSRQAKAA